MLPIFYLVNFFESVSTFGQLHHSVRDAIQTRDHSKSSVLHWNTKHYLSKEISEIIDKKKR